MYPGLSEADCQVAGFRYRQLVSEGQHQQLVSGVLPRSAETRSLLTTFQQGLGTLLVRAGHRLRGVNTITRQSADTLATGERAAIA